MNSTNKQTAGMLNTHPLMMNNSLIDDGEISGNSKTTALDNEDEISDAEELISSDKITKDVGTQVTTGDLIIYHSFLRKMSEPGLNSLTGIHSMALLETLVKLLQKDYGKLIRTHQMPLKYQVVLTFMRLKLDLPFASLSALFECTATTCKSIFTDVLKHLAVHLKCAIPWLSKEQILERIPKCFKPSYRNTRVILDCTEVSVTKTDCAKCRIMTYSQYKSKHTIKLMLGVAPSGVLTFITPVYGGRASDKEIFKQSNVVQFVEPHEDAIMVDRGFLIDDICTEHFIEVFRPPFLKQSRFSGSESTKNTSIARARVHVERMIQRIKIFKIFQSTIPWGMLPFINDMFIVCSGIANLGKPILADDKF